MHNTLVFATFPLHSSLFYHSTKGFVKFGAVLHHDVAWFQNNKTQLSIKSNLRIFQLVIESHLGRKNIGITFFIQHGRHCSGHRTRFGTLLTIDKRS